MDLPWGDSKSSIFTTNIGLITSDGPVGPNISSIEWTHHVSYSPGLIVVCIRPTDATSRNISATKEFGINLAAVDQNVAVSIAGNNSGHDVDKIKLFEELGFNFYKASEIKPLLLEGAAATFECKSTHQFVLGDHNMFVGEVITASISGKDPLVYNKGKFWNLGSQIHKPPESELSKIKEIIDKYRKR